MIKETQKYRLYLTETEDTTFGTEEESVPCTITVDTDKKICVIKSFDGDITEFEYTDYDYLKNDEGEYLYIENDPISYIFRDKPVPHITDEME